MAGLAAGDLDSLGLLYRRHADFVFRIAYRFLHNEEEAQDITQSVFVTLMQSARKYRPEAKVTTWIYRIVVNRCLNHRSRVKGRKSVSSNAPSPLETASAPAWEQPDHLVERAEQAARLREALLGLPKRQRIALLLRMDDELSYAEIAATLDCSRSSVESLLFRARSALVRHLRK